MSLLKGTAADLESNKLFRLLQESSPLRVSPKEKNIPFPQSSWASGRKNSGMERKGKMKESRGELQASPPHY